MRARWVILLSVVFGLMLCAIPSLLDWHLTRSQQRMLEDSYEKYAAGDGDTLYVMRDTPLIQKVVTNRLVAERVREVVFSDTDFAMLDITSLEELPNLDAVVIYSGKNCDKAIRNINRLPRLRTLTFADCGLTDAGFNELNNPNLATFGMSAFGKSWTDQTISELKQRMPTCKFEIEIQE